MKNFESSVIPWYLINIRAAKANLSQARSNILHQNVLTGCFLQERIETQNLGKDQTLPALPAMAALLMWFHAQLAKKSLTVSSITVLIYVS